MKSIVFIPIIGNTYETAILVINDLHQHGATPDDAK